ncbi:MAG: CapA family protein [Clostridia bacterium]|nr:CapA family protein [Clostridia bacterium]
MKKRLLLIAVAALMILTACKQNDPLADIVAELSASGTETVSEVSSEASASGTMKLTFLGDCLVSTLYGDNDHGTLNWYAENYKPSYFFEKVYDVLSADDFTIANCETVLTDRKLTPRPKGGTRAFWFYGPTSNAAIFPAGSVEVTGVVNNHMNDYYDAGYQDTLAALKKQNLIIGDYDKPVYLEKNGIKTAILFVDLWSLSDASGIIDAMNALDKDTDYKIIYFHGGIEGTNYPEQWKVDACRKLIDNGANFVIGAHPHVLQPIEEYNGGVIVYSLGNFLFGGNTAPVKNTIMFQLELKKDGYGKNVIPCQVYSGSRNNWQPCYPETEQSKQKTLDLLVMTDKRYTWTPSTDSASSETPSETPSDTSSETPESSEPVAPPENEGESGGDGDSGDGGNDGGGDDGGGDDGGGDDGAEQSDE